MLKPFAWGVALAAGCALAGVPSMAHAVPRTPLVRRAVPARGARARGALRVVAPVVPTLPPVALQLSGLQIHIPVARSAVVHAIARDAWPALVHCVTPSPRVRGHAIVTLRETEHGLDITADGSPLHRDGALSQCVHDAFEALILPPYDAERPETSVRFDLAFGLPPVGTPAHPIARRR